MLIDFHSGEFLTLYMTFLGKVIPKKFMITETIVLINSLVVIGNNGVHDERKQCRYIRATRDGRDASK
jgi:hypothetical protein